MFFYSRATDGRDGKTYFVLHVLDIESDSSVGLRHEDFFTRRLLATESIRNSRGNLMFLSSQTSGGYFANTALVFPSRYILPGKIVPPFVSMTVVHTWLQRGGALQERGFIEDAVLSKVNHDMFGLTVIDCRP
jgi:hypothetical protein